MATDAHAILAAKGITMDDAKKEEMLKNMNAELDSINKALSSLNLTASLKDITSLKEDMSWHFIYEVHSGVSFK